MPGTATGAVARKPSRRRAGDRAPRRDIGDDEREQRADGRGRGAEDNRVLQRRARSTENSMKTKTTLCRVSVDGVSQSGGVRREGRVEQREIGQEDRAAAARPGRSRAPAQRQPFSSTQPRRATLAADDGIAAAPEDAAFAPCSSSMVEQQQRHRRGGSQFELRRILEQAPDLRGDGVEAGRQRQDRGRAEQGHRLQEGDQGACDAAPAAPAES